MRLYTGNWKEVGRSQAVRLAGEDLVVVRGIAVVI